VTRLYLVRHGHAEWTPDEMRPLSATGREQALGVADVLVPVAPTVIYASPWTRARQTVEPLAARLGLPIATVTDLRERQLSNRTVEDFIAASRATWDDFSFAHPGGESNAVAQQRGVAAIRAIAARHADRRIVIATHGTLLALILNAYDPAVDFAFWHAVSTPDIYRLDLRHGPAAIRRIWL
jgi:2,3-bisphosphoglycerate-dependent phosphoglycerate mutase